MFRAGHTYRAAWLMPGRETIGRCADDWTVAVAEPDVEQLSTQGDQGHRRHPRGYRPTVSGGLVQESAMR